MSAERRMAALHERHHHLEDAISEELSHPHPDDVRLHELKKKKLAIRDEIEGHVPH